MLPSCSWKRGGWFCCLISNPNLSPNPVVLAAILSSLSVAPRAITSLECVAKGMPHEGEGFQCGTSLRAQLLPFIHSAIRLGCKPISMKTHHSGQLLVLEVFKPRTTYCPSKRGPHRCCLLFLCVVSYLFFRQLLMYNQQPQKSQ